MATVKKAKTAAVTKGVSVPAGTKKNATKTASAATPKKVPAKKPAVPVKKAATPAKKPASVPVKKASPAKKPAVTAKKPVAPAKKAVAPAKKMVAPVKKPDSAKKTEPAKKASVPPAKPAVLNKKTPPAPAPAPKKKPNVNTKPASEKKASATSGKSLPEPAQFAPPPVIHPATPGTKKLVKAEILELRETLLADREQLLRVVNHLHGNSLAQSEGINLEEDGTELSSQIFGLNSASDAEARIRQIDEAIQAIDAGTYGYCTICGNMINPARLRALPSAKTCIRCQSAAENTNNGRIFVRGRI